MNILKAKYILICDENFTILKDMAIAFDDRIHSIGKFDEIYAKFKDTIIYDYSDSIVMPSLINTHTHLEFSQNLTSLYYGDFLKWVKSIVEARIDLTSSLSGGVVTKAINTMIKSGVGTIGAVSSYGLDTNECVSSPARVVLFSEILGANDSAITKNWDNFLSRFEKIAKLKSDNFIPAISVHAPYSTRSELAKKAAKFAKDNSLILSTHFLESEYEKQWLFNGNGEFKEWLSFFDKNIRPFYDGYEFIEYFESVRTLFTHCVYVDDFGVFDPSLHSVTTCGVSNRLISKPLNLSAVLDSGLSLNIGTDGLSSNISLNFFDELRANLLIHSEIDLPNLAKTLLLASTLSGAKALGLENGSLEAGKLADIAVFKGFEVCDEDQIALELILQTKESETIFIGGKEWKL